MRQSFKALAAALLFAIAFVAMPASATDPCDPCFGGGGGGTTTAPGWTSSQIFGLSGVALGESQGYAGGQVLQGTGTTFGTTQGSNMATVTGSLSGTTDFCPTGCGGVTGNLTATFGATQQSTGGAEATSPTFSNVLGGSGARATGGASIGLFR